MTKVKQAPLIVRLNSKTMPMCDVEREVLAGLDPTKAPAMKERLPPAATPTPS